MCISTRLSYYPTGMVTYINNLALVILRPVKSAHQSMPSYDPDKSIFVRIRMARMGRYLDILRNGRS